MIQLPKKPNNPVRTEPALFLIYAPPKVGKTTLVSALENNLILDLESGTHFLEALSVNIIGWAPPKKEKGEEKEQRIKEQRYYLTEVGQQIIADKRPYKFITVDTITVLEEMVGELALEKYRATPMGANFEGKDVLELARGAGYYYIRIAFKEAIDKIKKLADNIILIAHLKETIVDKQGKEVAAKDIDLTGKLKNITCADADAIGYLYRGDDDALYINFKSSDQITCGSRCGHLKGQVIKMADYDEETNSLININWKGIYPDSCK